MYQTSKLAFLVLQLSSVITIAQNPANDDYWNNSQIAHNAGQTMMSVKNSRPLWTAINALEQENGWAVNYEEPSYAQTETVLAHNAQWDSMHPERPSRIPAGLSFIVNLNQDSRLAKSSSSRLTIIQEIVTRYNESGNPGVFTATLLSNGQIDVIGRSRGGTQSNDLLDTPILLPAGRFSAATALSQLTEALSAASGSTVGVARIPANLLVPARVELPGGSHSARSLLQLIVDSGRISMQWDLLFDWDSDSFFLNIEPQSVLATDRMGNQVVRWIPKAGEQ